MPVSKHFKGKGEKVMRSMQKTYGPEKAKQVFYATENKQKKAGTGFWASVAAKSKRHD